MRLSLLILFSRLPIFAAAQPELAGKIKEGQRSPITFKEGTPMAGAAQLKMRLRSSEAPTALDLSRESYEVIVAPTVSASPPRDSNTVMKISPRSAPATPKTTEPEAAPSAPKANTPLPNSISPPSEAGTSSRAASTSPPSKALPSKTCRPSSRQPPKPRPASTTPN